LASLYVARPVGIPVARQKFHHSSDVYSPLRSVHITPPNLTSSDRISTDIISTQLSALWRSDALRLGRGQSQCTRFRWNRWAPL